MNVARPIKPSEYQEYRKELYTMEDGKETGIKFTVALDADPSMNPKAISEHLAKVQSFKDRVLVILNRSILCESYWRTVHKRVESKYDAELQRAMLTETVRSSKNSEMREAEATKLAHNAVVTALFLKDGAEPEEMPKYEDQMSTVVTNLSDAIAFLSEVKNIYENLDHTSRNLAVQLKSVMVNAKVYGDPSGDPTDDALAVSR